MAYGTVKVDNITFDNGGSDQNVTVSGLYRATTSGVTLSGTIAATVVSGVTVIGSTTVSGATVTGTTANFTSGNFGNIISSAATMSGALIMANQQQVRFREAIGNGVNHIALQAPAVVSADQTITLPDQTGTIITTGDNGSVSSAMLATNLTISAAAGSASTPSIAFTGDTNTGIYSPGADQVAISTNGTEKVRIDTSGNVIQNYYVYDPGNAAGFITGTAYKIGSNSAPGIAIAGRNGTNSNAGFITFDGISTNGNAKTLCSIGSIQTNTSTNRANGELVFYTNGDATSATPNERLRITSGGLVGLGTSSPVYLVDAQGGRALFTDNSSTFSVGVRNRASLAPNGNFWIGATNAVSPDMVFSNNAGNERMRITDNGSVGIGTTSPNAALDVRSAATWIGDGTADAFLQFNQSATAANRWHIGAGSSNALVFYKGTYGSGSEAARVDSSGRLLVGTSTSIGVGAKLQTVDDSSANPLELIASPNNDQGPNLNTAKARGSTASPTVVSSGDILGRWRFRGYDGSAYQIGADIAVQVDGTPGANDMPGRLVFSTTADGASSPTERMRIHANGFITYGTGSVDSTGLTFGPTRSGTGSAPTLTWNGSFAGTTTACDFLYNGARQGSITTTTSATAYNTSSDYRLKENIEPLTGASSRLSQLQVHRFNFIADPDHTVDGFIAHEAQAVVPECVTGEKNAVDADGNPVYQGIDQSKLVPLLTAALQEAIAKIETLEARLTAAGIA